MPSHWNKDNAALTSRGSVFSAMIGQTISHYRILERIGAGGMGEVYRAHDDQLDRDVAVKVLHGKAIQDEGGRQRLRMEALSLARLNHPNIAIVYEFGSDGVDFLVTEYIPGITLDTKLAEGALSESEVIRLGVQLAEGLEAAHEQGVIHRDLKPANLRLATTGRLKILDFGIAHLAQPDLSPDLTASLTIPHEITGTLPYMAPEQLRGEKADVRSDIWAAGVVLYEMAAGRRPFAQTTSPLLMSAILNEAPPPLRSIKHQVSSRLQSAILKALEKDPFRRYQSAHELRTELERLATGAKPAAALVSRWTSMAAVLSLIILLLGGFSLWRSMKESGRSSLSTGASIRTRRSVAVLGFKNLSGRTDVSWLSTALSEMLTTELAAGGQLLAVPGENVARMKIDLSIPDAASYSRDTLGRIRGIMNANYVVLGSYLDLGAASGGDVRLDVRVQDTQAGETLALLSVRGTEAQLDDLVSRAGTDLRKKLGVEATASAPRVASSASPSIPGAARFYSEGLARLRSFDAEGARHLLERAIDAEPGFPLAHSALATAWKELRYDDNAKNEAKRAFELSAALPREERLSVEAGYRETISD
jgi:serine/threonine protein kinase